MSTCLLGIGSNLGDREGMLREAVGRLDADENVRVMRVSARMKTDPIGGPPGQSVFLNGAVLLETRLNPQQLLSLAQRIESQLGRQRGAPWDARPIDLDLLLCDDWVLSTPELTLPHRWLPVRRFALEPSCEIAPEMKHPVLGWSVARMVAHLDQTPPQFIVVGADAETQAGVEAALSAALEKPKGERPHTPARTSTVPADRPQIEWVARAGCQELLARRLSMGRSDARLPRAFFLVNPSPDVLPLPREPAEQLVAANRSPFVVVNSLVMGDRIREIVGGVLATLSSSALPQSR